MPLPRVLPMVLAGCLAAAGACSPSLYLEHEGGSWYTGSGGSTHTGLAKVDLYHVDSAGRRSRVDEDVLVHRHYPPDCLVYEPGRDPGAIWVVCGAHEPVQVAFHAPWRLAGGYDATGDGLLETRTMRVVDGRVVAEVAFIALDEIVRAAHATPLRASDWLPPDESGHSVLEAAVTEVPVDPAARGRGGETPLLAAVRDSQPDVVTALLRLGADPNARDGLGWSPLSLAIGAPWPDTALISALVAGGADVELADPTGTPPLLVAALGRKADVFALLLRHGANPCARDRQERTIVQLAGDHATLRPMAVDAYRRCGAP